jgi:predicted DNA-binding transcriptional regulator AlpA
VGYSDADLDALNEELGEVEALRDPGRAQGAPIADVLELLAPGQVAGLLRVDLRTLRRLALECIVPAPILIGERTVRYRRCDIEEWLGKRLEEARRSRLHVSAMTDTAGRSRRGRGR